MHTKSYFLLSILMIELPSHVIFCQLRQTIFNFSHVRCTRKIFSLESQKVFLVVCYSEND